MTPIPIPGSDPAATAPAWSRILVLLVGLLLILSCGAHGILGWKMVRQALVDAGTPIDVVDTVRLGWHFGSVSMAAFGIIVLLAWSGMRGRPWPLRPGIVIACTYILFGIVAAIASLSLHFVFLFVIPGVLLLAGLGLRR